MDLREMGGEVVDWIHGAQEGSNLGCFKRWVSIKAENFLTI